MDILDRVRLSDSISETVKENTIFMQANDPKSIVSIDKDKMNIGYNSADTGENTTFTYQLK